MKSTVLLHHLLTRTWIVLLRQRGCSAPGGMVSPFGLTLPQFQFVSQEMLLISKLMWSDFSRCKRAHAWLRIVPRGLSRTDAAAYIGVSSSLFDQMVADGRMPKPKPINSRMVWDRWELDAAFSALPHKDATATDDDEWGVAV
jgi:predicted DNA-binding transcriptional regulator AlpA